MNIGNIMGDLKWKKIQPKEFIHKITQSLFTSAFSILKQKIYSKYNKNKVNKRIVYHPYLHYRYICTSKTEEGYNLY